MKPRLASAAVGIPLLVLAVISGVPAVGGVAIAAALIAGYEIARMSAPAGGRPSIFIAATPPAAVAAALAAHDSNTDWWLVGTAAGAGIVLALTFEAARPARSRLWLAGVLAAVYFGVLLAHAPFLRALDDNGWWLLTGLLTTFAADTVAFYTGRAFGSRPLAPTLSPRKTWEGAAGGLVGGIAAALILSEIFDLNVELGAAALIGAAVAATAVAGDLVESAFKRAAGVKDAGAIIPGHGGILDRLDSLAPGLAVVYWFAVWLST